MSAVKKRDYDADLERLKTFIDSYHNNDPDRNCFFLLKKRFVVKL